MKVQRLAIVFTVTFAAAEALVVGQRLSTEMMAVIVGVVAGVAASIPATLIIVWVVRHALASLASSDPAYERKPEPSDRETKITMVPAPSADYPAGNTYLPSSAFLTSCAPAAVPRHFRIIGGEAAPAEDL